MFPPNRHTLNLAVLLIAAASLLAASASATAARRQAGLAPANYLPLVAIPRMQQLAFSSSHTGNNEIYLINANGSQPVNLTNNPSEDIRPAWSPDGSRLLFLSNRDDRTRYQIFLMDADGSNQLRLTDEPSGAYTPAWSPDGTTIAYFTAQAQRFDLYLVRADGSGRALLASEPVYASYLSWSPDGQLLAFLSTNAPASSSMRVFVLRVGDATRTIASSYVAASTPVWFPGGTRLAFLSMTNLGSCSSTHAEVVAAGVDGAGQRQLTFTPNDCSTSRKDQLSISPDGASLAFSAGSPGRDIYVVNADGSGLSNITRTPAIELLPAWSADSRQIAVAASSGSAADLYRMSADGSNHIRLTRDLEVNSLAWRP